MIKLLNKYASLFKISIIGLIIIGLAYMIYDYSKSKEQLKNLITENKELEYRIDNIKDQYEEQSRQLSNIRSNYQQIEVSFNRQREELAQLKRLTNREVIEQQPEIEQSINDTFRSINRQVQCYSGDTERCVQ